MMSMDIIMMIMVIAMVSIVIITMIIIFRLEVQWQALGLEELSAEKPPSCYLLVSPQHDNPFDYPLLNPLIFDHHFD